MMSSKKERVCICNLSKLTVQIIVNTWWTSINAGWKWPIAKINSGHTPSWSFYFHCGIEETGSPGIICIVCHEAVCHPSEHGTNALGKHWLTKAHIAKLNS
jgi:hypothetical protein